jgi:transcriptional antiterminator NusG
MGREQAVSLMQSELMKEENKVETAVAKDVVEAAVAENEAEKPLAEDQIEVAAVVDEVEATGAEDEIAAVVEEAKVETPAVEAKSETDAVEDEAEAKAAAQNTKQRWYVVHAYSGFESYVKKVLESRIAMSEHKDKFGNIMVPTEEVVEMREGSRRKSERKFFPGYVLVQMEMDSDTWHMVKQVPKVLGFIGGTSDKPAPITEAEADAILNRVEEGVDRPRPKVLFEVGEVVRVNDGPFNDFNGVVEEVNYEKSKMLVSVQIFGRSTPVELAFGQVEKG